MDRWFLNVGYTDWTKIEGKIEVMDTGIGASQLDYDLAFKDWYEDLLISEWAASEHGLPLNWQIKKGGVREKEG